MEVNVLQRDSLLCRSDDAIAGSAAVGVVLVEAPQAHGIVVWSVIRHIFLVCQRNVTVEAAKVLDVEVLVIGSGVLRDQNKLVAPAASRNFHQLGQVTSAVDLVVEVEVDEIDQQLVALLAFEALRMPLRVLAQLLCLDVSVLNVFRASAARQQV